MFINREKYIELEEKEEKNIKDDSHISGLRNNKMEKQ